MPSRAWMTTVAAGAAVLLTALVWLAPSPRDFAPDNPTWNGLTEFVRAYHISLVSADALAQGIPGTLLVAMPRHKFEDQDILKMRDYVTAGGTLLLADDFGWGNQVARELGLDARFSEIPLYDPLVNEKNQGFPKADVVTRIADDKSFAVLLNYPTSLERLGPGQALALSSRFSFLDSNGNRAWNKDEPMGSFPIAASVSLGAGNVLLLADPSVFINSMFESNRAFIRQLIGGKRVMLYAQNLPPDALSTVQSVMKSGQKGLATQLGLMTSITLAIVVPISLILRNYPRGV